MKAESGGGFFMVDVDGHHHDPNFHFIIHRYRNVTFVRMVGMEPATLFRSQNFSIADKAV